MTTTYVPTLLRYLAKLQIAAMFLWIASFQTVSAQTACPNDSVHGGSSPAWAYAYQTAERGPGTCTNAITIPSNGSRQFSSRADCRAGRFRFVGEHNGGIRPQSLLCPDCIANNGRDVRIAPNSSAQITAYFRYSDGEVTRYSALISRSAEDANGYTQCSITNGQVSGVSFGGDATQPTATLGAPSGPVGGVYTVAVTLSEASTNLTVSDFDLGNANATLTGTGTSYTLTVTPIAQGAWNARVKQRSFTDAALNPNRLASNQVGATFDSILPTVVISGAPTVALVNSFDVDVTFSETVVGFVAGDIAVGNASVTALTGSGANYVATILPSGLGNITLQMPAAMAQDASGNTNIASTVVSISNETATETQRQIASFVANRANQLVQQQPDLICQLSGGCGRGSFNLAAQNGELRFNFAAQSANSTWVRLSGSRINDGAAQADYLFGAIGTHRKINTDTVVGLTLQIDHQSQQDGVAKISGTGWMAGPYIVGKLPNQPLYYEGRFLYGRSENKINPFGTYTDTFQTERWLVQAKVAGQVNLGETIVTPSLKGSYTKDTQFAYTDGLGQLIAKQSIELAEFTVGIDFAKPIQLGTAEWVLIGGASTIYSMTDGSETLAPIDVGFDGVRGKVHLGALRTLRNGGKISIGTYYDGIGSDGYDAYGIEIGYKMQF